MPTIDDDIVLGLERGMVRLVAADPRWPLLYAAEAGRLASAVQDAGLPPLVLEHIGSTAVPGLVAKPIIDLMAGYASEDDAGRRYLEAIVAAGYEPRGPQGVPGRELLVRGPRAARTHHLNLVSVGGRFWREHIYFRDRLRAEPELASAYAALKRELAARHAHDRGAYTEGKARFVASVLGRGRAMPSPGG